MAGKSLGDLAKEVKRKRSGAPSLEDLTKEVTQRRYSEDVGKVDDAYVKSFFDDAGVYLSDSQKELEGMTWESANSYAVRDSRYSKSQDLGYRANLISYYLENNKDRLDNNSYTNLSKALSEYQSGFANVNTAYDEAQKYYSQWDSEDAYNQTVAQWKDYEEKKNADTGALQAEIDALENAYKEAESIALNIGLVTMGGNESEESYLGQIRSVLSKAGNYSSMKDLEKAIADKKKYLYKASMIQKGEELASVADTASANYDQNFGDLSKYVSNVKYALGGKPTFTDKTYAYINNPTVEDKRLGGGMTTARALLEEEHDIYAWDTPFRGSESSEASNALDYLTEEEIAIYNYYFNKGDKASADAYLSYIQEAISYRKAQDMFDNMKGKPLLEMVFGVEAGLDQFSSGVQSLFNTDDYIPTSATQYASGMVREDFNGLGKVAYDLITTGANMLPSVLTSVAVGAINPAAGAVAGNALMGASAAGNAYASAINSGYDKGSARFYSTAIGASEVLLGQLIGGISKLGGITPALEKALSGIDNGIARFALQYGGQIVSEGIEEGLQEILDPILQNAILNADESVNWSEVAYSALLGALSAGVMEGPGTVVGIVKDAKANKNAVNQYGDFTGDLIQEGLLSDPSSESYRLAQKFQKQTEGENGKAMSGYQIRQLVEANEAQFAVEDYNSAVNTAKEKLTQLGETKDVDKIAKLAAKRATGQELTRTEKSTLARSDYGAQVANEMITPAEQAQGNTKAYDVTYKSLESRVEAEEPAKVSNTGKAVIRSANEEIDLASPTFKQVGEDGVVLEANGKTVNANDIDFESEEQGSAINAIGKIEHITPAAAGALYAKLDMGKPVMAQLNGMDEAFTYGFYNYSEADLNAGLFVGGLTQEQKTDAYKLGQYVAKNTVTEKADAMKKMRTAAEANAANQNVTSDKKAFTGSDAEVYFMDGKTLRKFEESGKYDGKRMAGVNYAKFLSKLGIGRKYVFFESYKKGDKLYYKDANGVEKLAPNGIYTKDGTIYIDLNAGAKGDGTTLFTLGHELTHFIKQWSDAKFQVLADFLIKEYGKTDMSMHQRVLEKQSQLEKSRGEKVSYDEAFEEVVADAMSTMLSDGNLHEKLAKLKAQDKSLFNRIKKFFEQLVAKFKKLYAELAPDQKDAQDVRKMKKAFDRIQTAFAEALVEASENFQASLTPGVESVATNQNGDPVAYSTEDGTVMLSMRTFDENGRTELRKYLNKCVSSNKMTKTEMQEMLDGIEEIYTICKEFKDKYAPFSTWSDAAVVRDTHGRPVFSVVTPNGDYKMNLDFSLVCKKRRTLDAVFNEMSKRGIIDDFELGQKSVVKINEIIRSYGLETACALCFVDAKRFRQASVADSFTSLYNELVLSLVPEDKRSSISHFNFAGYDTIKAVENGIHTWKTSDLDFSHLDYVMKNYESGTVEHKAAKYIKSNAEGRKLLLRGDFMSSKGFDAVKTQNPAMMKLYNSKKGTGGPKAAFGDVQYLNEIVKKSKNWTPAKAYEVGGVRIQSFSDYVPRMVFDYVQMIYDLAATKLPAHAYTKEAMFVKQFGLTGVKINMSLIPAIKKGGVAPGLDANGNYVWAGESFDYETAKEIQNAEGYTENCGTICVGVSYQHIVKLLGDPNIRMVIPYHKSGLNPIVAHMNKLAEFTDYTSLKTNPGGCQNTMDKNGSKVEKDFNFNEALRKTGDPKATARQYLDWCAANEYKPRFAEFAWHENYYKLLEDFTLYDKDGNYVPQREVRAVFPKDGAAFGSMKELIESGLEEDAIVEGKRDSSLASIVDEIQRTLPKTEAEISEEQVKQADHDLENVKHSDREYLDAVSRGDTETAQKMVDEAARKAGYTVKVYHGTPWFGFTKIDLAKSDDNISFFATDSMEVAETYSGKGKVKRVSDDAYDSIDEIEEAFLDKANDLCYAINSAAGHQSYIGYDAFDEYWQDAARGTVSMDYIRDALYEDVENTIQELFAYSEYYERINDEDVDEDELYDEFIMSDEIQRIYSTANDIEFILRGARADNGGNYQLYANTDNFLEIDAKGNAWHRIPFAEYDKNKRTANTRQVAAYAKANGYDGVKLANVFDDGGRSVKKQSAPATVYIFFNPQEQVKSADPVTYDNAGNAIPLSERFKKDNDDIRYSERSEFRGEIEKWRKDGSPDDETFILGSTGDVIQGLGAIESDIYMIGEKINTILATHKEITLDEIKKIPQILENPILILESRNVGRSSANTRMVLFGSVKAKNGLPVTTILDLRPVENHLVIDDMQKVTSAYTKDSNPVQFVQNSNVLYMDKKRATSLLRTIGFQMPIELNKSGFLGNIAYENQKVNMHGVPFAEVLGETGTKFSERTNAPVFYSKMGKVVEGVKQEKFGASSVISMLRGRGVKAEEIRWSGIHAFLDGKKSVTKQELLEFIQGSMLHIEEETTEETVQYTDEQSKQLRILSNEREQLWEEMDKVWFMTYGTVMPMDLYVADNATRRIRRKISTDGIDETNGGKRLRELALALDENDLKVEDIAADAKRNSNLAKWGDYKLDGGDNYREILFKMPGADYSNPEMRNHWGKNAEGILAHARLQDFDVDGKKMLFIEEIQSDWHNAGQKYGYQMTLDEEKQKSLDLLQKKREAELELRQVISSMDKELEKIDLAEAAGEQADTTKYTELAQKYNKIRSTIVSANTELGKMDMYRSKRAPHAPFAENYHEFVLKRILRMAAEEGYDSIGWTTADIQSKRWSPQYAKGYQIEYDQDIPKFLKKYGKQWGAEVGKTALDSVNQEKKYYDANRQEEYDSVDAWKDEVITNLSFQGLPVRDLRKVRFVESDGYLIAEDPETGLEYDRAEIRTPSDMVWSMDITPAMKKSVLEEGQEMYSERTGDSVSNRSLLANAFEGIVQNSEEYKMLQDYKERIKELNKLESKLSDLNREIRKIRFTEGEYDAKKLHELESEAKDVAKEINRHDWKLLNLEASEPLRRVIDRERKKASQETRDHVKQIQQNKKDRAEQAELRQKIRKKVRDLDKILNRGNKKQNVKEDMKGFVSKALELAAYLFTDHVSNDELIRRGINPNLIRGEREAQLVRETEEILSQLYDHADSLTDEEFTRLDAKRKANEDKLRDLLTAQRNERLQTPVYDLFSDLVTEYSAFKNSSQDAVKAAYNPEVERFLRSYVGDEDSSRAKTLKNMRVADMTTEELWKLDNAYQMVLHAVRTANKLFVKGKTESIEQVVTQIVTEFGSRKIPEKNKAIALQKLGNKIGWDYEKLYYALDRIGSKAFTDLIMNLANSEDIVMQDIIEAAEFRDEMVKKYGFNNWDVNKEIDREFLDHTGKKFKLTLGQLMSLYAYSRREGAWDHIEYGGFVFGEAALTNPKPADSFKLSKEQCEAITGTLTKEQKGYVEDMQKFLSETMGGKGNEVSMMLYGIKMFGEKNYFPIHIAGQFKAQAQESQAKQAAGFGSMSNAGFTHAQNPKAKAPFVLEGFNDVWVDHVNEMSRYHGTVPALEDLRRVMNRSSYAENTAESTSVKVIMENHFGKEAVEYFDNLYREANSGAITDKLQQKSKKLLSLFRKNSVAYSLSVLVQQPASMVRAYAMIDRKYFGFKGVGAITSGVYKAVSSKWNSAYADAYNEMLKYAPGVTMTKEIGGFDTATGGSIRSYLLDTDKSFKQKWKTGTAKEKGQAVLDVVDNNPIANLPNVADKIAWIEIWNACKRETLAKHKDLAPTSDEFMKIVGDRFTEVIRATQVYDSIFAKSPILKSNNLAVQMLVSFMNEPNTVANMAESAVRDFAKGNRMDGLKKAHVLVHSIIFTGLLKSLIYAMRDDDEDETYIEKYIESLTGSLMDDFNPFNYIPFARDVWSIAQGYDVERADMAVVADAIGALNKVIKAASTDRDGMTEDELIELDKKITKASWNLVDALSAFTGIPMKNVRREINAVIDHAKIAHSNAGKTTAMSTWDTIYDAVIDSIPFMGGKSKTDKLYAAIIEGDTEYINRMKDTYKTEDSYHTAVRKALRENDPRVKEAAQAQINGDPSKRVSIAKQIITDGFILDDVVAAINSEINAMTTSDSDSGAKKEKGYYTAADIAIEAANGDWASVRAIKDDIIQTAQKNGKTKDEAEESFESSVRSNAKEAYLNGSLGDAAAKKLLTEYAGMDEDEAASRVNYWAFCRRNSKYADDISESQYGKYTEFAEPAGIPVDVFARYVTGTAGLTDIKDKWGDVVKSKREQVLEVIDSLPLTWKQKDALYLAAGYAESKIWDVPW